MTPGACGCTYLFEKDSFLLRAYTHGLTDFSSLSQKKRPNGCAQCCPTGQLTNLLTHTRTHTHTLVHIISSTATEDDRAKHPLLQRSILV
mmetsp:Transcript_32635/g.69998  ORF Transcript_32635/g.69998 Transcript_32635/m.69998 type:complete len:90 (-) Transcript_32635:8-277(-)